MWYCSLYIALFISRMRNCYPLSIFFICPAFSYSWRSPPKRWYDIRDYVPTPLLSDLNAYLFLSLSVFCICHNSSCARNFCLGQVPSGATYVLTCIPIMSSALWLAVNSDIEKNVCWLVSEHYSWGCRTRNGLGWWLPVRRHRLGERVTWGGRGRGGSCKNSFFLIRTVHLLGSFFFIITGIKSGFGAKLFGELGSRSIFFIAKNWQGQQMRKKSNYYDKKSKHTYSHASLQDLKLQENIQHNKTWGIPQLFFGGYFWFRRTGSSSSLLLVYPPENICPWSEPGPPVG
jgi:hypothetical protein